MAPWKEVCPSCEGRGLIRHVERCTSCKGKDPKCKSCKGKKKEFTEFSCSYSTGVEGEECRGRGWWWNNRDL